MDKYSNNVIYEKVVALTDKVNEGFKGMHKRQDKTNGNIEDNRTDIGKLKVWRGVITGGLIIIMIIVIPLVIYVFQNIK